MGQFSPSYWMTFMSHLCKADISILSRSSSQSQLSILTRSSPPCLALSCPLSPNIEPTTRRPTPPSVETDPFIKLPTDNNITALRNQSQRVIHEAVNKLKRAPSTLDSVFHYTTQSKAHSVVTARDKHPTIRNPSSQLHRTVFLPFLPNTNPSPNSRDKPNREAHCTYD